MSHGLHTKRSGTHLQLQEPECLFKGRCFAAH